MSGQMTFADFLKSSAVDATPPAGLPIALQAMWQDRHGNWDHAHDLAQESGGADGAWVHAYLHRKEGDDSNAAYWYQLASQPIANGDFAVEWETITRELLGRKS
jgi:hypothetical protein